MIHRQTTLIEKLEALMKEYINLDRSGSAEDALEDAIAIVRQRLGIAIRVIH